MAVPGIPKRRDFFHYGVVLRGTFPSRQPQNSILLNVEFFVSKKTTCLQFSKGLQFGQVVWPE